MNATTRTLLAGVLIAVADPSLAQEVSDLEPVVGLPCEGCELVFAGMPDDLDSKARIAPENEPGEPLRIEGRVVNPDGTPAPGTIIYAYHTNAQGIYPGQREAETRGVQGHGRLRAWVRADEDGRYTFRTIRPASYPDSRNPQHVHMHVIEPGCCTYWIDSVHFRDDPLLPRRLAEAESGRGGLGVVTPEREADGTWVARRDIVLGQEVPGHPTPSTQRRRP